MKNLSIIFATLILIATLSACKKDQSANSLNNTVNNHYISGDSVFVPSGLHTDGYGSSTKAMTGTSLSFPDGVTLVSNTIHTDPASCSSFMLFSGNNSGTIDFYLTLSNRNGTSQKVIFPAGTAFPSPDTLDQNGIIILPDTIVIPSKSTVCVNLLAFCLNDHRNFNANSQYGPPLLSDNDNLIPLFRLLNTNHAIAGEHNEILQNIVWHISNSGSMNQEDIETINTYF